MNTLDDPRFTAYLLNELDDADRAAVEAELAANPELRSSVDGLQATVQQLRIELDAEVAAAQVASGAQPVEARRDVAESWRRSMVHRMFLLAACLVVAFGVVSLLMPAFSGRWVAFGYLGVVRQ